jgi:outer membrane receptor protein involved in Fe transport
MRRIDARIAAVLALLIAGTASAGVTGKISGRVLDRLSQQPLVGANVVVEGTALGASSDLDGYFFIINVPPGRYDVTASYIGYQTLSQSSVFVQVDHTTELDFTLDETALEAGEVVVVVAEQAEIQRDVTSTRVNITSDQIENLPINSISDVLRLQAGVVSTGGSSFHVRGGRTNELAYFVDGHRIEDPIFSRNYTDVNTAAIEQMEMLTGTFNAEYGNAMSGVINIVTKENTERIKGEISQKVSALGLEQSSDNLNLRYMEGYISGPLFPGKNAGFLLSGKRSFEDNIYQSGKLSLINGEWLPAGELSDDAFGYDDLYSFFGKVFFEPIKKTKLSFSYNYDDREWLNYDHDYKYLPDSAYVRASDSQLFALNFTHAPAENWFYETRLSFYQYSYLKNYGGFDWTEYSLASGNSYDTYENGTYYTGEFLATADNEEFIEQAVQTYTEKLDLAWQYNRYHQFKTGIELKQHDLDYFWIYGPQRTVNTYTTTYHIYPHEGAVYLQDKIEFRSLILNAGLRWDYYHPNITYIDDPFDLEGSATDAAIKQHFSPRLSISYPISDRMVFHLSYGHFFQRPPFEVLYEDLSRNLNVNKPLFGDPDLEPEITQSYELGVNARVNPNLRIQGTVFSKKITDLIGVAWVFAEAGVPSQYSYYTNEDFAYVKGFEIGAEYDYRRLSGGINYTYSIAEGSSSSQMERFTGAYDVKGRQSLQFYPMSFDQRHMVNAYVDVSFRKREGPFGFAPSIFQNSYLSLVFRYGSGLPYTYNPTRKRYEPDLNNARMPDTYTFDLEAEKRFPLPRGLSLSVFCEIYNLLDTENVRDVYNFTGEPDDYGEGYSQEFDKVPTNYYPPRVIYLGLSLDF